MCTSVFWVVDVQDPTQGVTGFTSVTVSLASFWAYSWKLPHGANGAESLQELGHMCVFVVPSD